MRVIFTLIIGYTADSSKPVERVALLACKGTVTTTAVVVGVHNRPGLEGNNKEAD